MNQIIIYLHTSYSSKAPDNKDWLIDGGDAAISGVVRKGDELWLAWTASRGAGTNNGFNFPNSHVRVATIRTSNWTLISEMQIWNDDYAFVFPTLNTNSDEEVGVGVAFGGNHDYSDAAFGIICDFVVWYENSGNTAVDRWGDFITIRRSKISSSWFVGFGYYILKDTSVLINEIYQKHYYVLFGRQSQVP